jgi:hypothetical protein
MTFCSATIIKRGRTKLVDAGQLSLLDRSPGQYGDGADDVTSVTLNYLFFSLQRSGKPEGDFEKLVLRF